MTPRHSDTLSSESTLPTHPNPHPTLPTPTHTPLWRPPQKRMAKSYMSLSITTLRMLTTFAADAATAEPFLRQPLLVGAWGKGGAAVPHSVCVVGRS